MLRLMGTGSAGSHELTGPVPMSGRPKCFLSQS